MRPYWALFSARFRMLLQYRAAALAGIATQIFFGYVILAGYRAFYSASPGPHPLSLEQMVTYVWLGQAMLGFLPWYADPDVREMMRDGSVAYQMLRPMGLYGVLFCRALARRAAPTLLRAAPMFVVAFPFLGLDAPASVASGLAWAAGTLGALMVSGSIATLLGISLFWTISGEGVNRFVPGFMMLFSGMLVPIPFYTEAIQPLLNVLPFRAIVDIPFRLYLGDIPPGQAWSVLLHQWVWVLLLGLLGYGLTALGRRRLVVQGG